MPRSTTKEMAVLRAEVWERANSRCEWPGCVELPTELAHLTHRGMGGSRERNTSDNACAMCSRHHDVLDGRTALGSLRWELNEMLRWVVRA